MRDITELFCSIDDFWKKFETLWHQSPINFIVNIFAGLIAYTLQPKKPALNFNEQELKLLTIT